MSQKFEFFEGARTESKTPQVTVRRSGQMVLTSAAVALLGDDATHVQFGYDAGTAAVAIRAAGEGAKGRYRLRRQTNGSSLADGRRFFAHHGLKVEKARTFDVESFGDGSWASGSPRRPLRRRRRPRPPSRRPPGAPNRSSAPRRDPSTGRWGRAHLRRLSPLAVPQGGRQSHSAWL